MDMTEDSDTLVVYGGYHQEGNKLYLLSNLRGIGDDDWEEEWKEGMLSLKTIPTLSQHQNSRPKCPHIFYKRYQLLLSVNNYPGSKLFLHGGYGANGSDSKFHAWSSMEEIDLEGTLNNENALMCKISPVVL